MKSAKKYLKKYPEALWQEAVRRMPDELKRECLVEAGLFPIGANPYVDKLAFKCGEYSPLSDYPYVDLIGKRLKKGPADYRDVREKLEKEADEIGMEAMTARLQEIDPEAAARIHDRKRILRALEVYLETGETITAHNLKTQAIPPRYSPLWLGLDFADRAELYRRIDLRVSIMLEQGLVEEIRALLNSGIPQKCTAMQAIGYKEFVAALEGKISMEEAAAATMENGRRLFRI